MTITENIKKFSEKIEKDDELKAKIETLDGKDDAIEQLIAIAKEYGYALTEEDFNALTEEDINALTDEDFKETGSESLSLDDLDSVAGGNLFGLRMIVGEMRLRSQMHPRR